MDNKTAMKHHLGNISRRVGRDVTNRYNYIVSSDDLTNAYLKMRHELHYPLMMDSKYRRAIIYNKQGLEKKIQDMINECIIANILELDKMIADDIVNEIANGLSGLTQTANGKIVVGNRSRSNSSMTSMFVKSLAKGLVKGVGKIIDDITNPKYDKNR